MGFTVAGSGCTPGPPQGPVNRALNSGYLGYNGGYLGGSRYGIGFRGLGFREMGLEQLSEPSSSKQRDACEQTACGAVRSVCQSRHGGSSRFLRDPPGSCRLQSAWQLGMIMSSGAKFLWPHARYGE